MQEAAKRHEVRFLLGGFDYICMLEEPVSMQMKVCSRDPHKLDSKRGCLPRFIIIPRHPRYQRERNSSRISVGFAAAFWEILSVELEYHSAVSCLRLPSASIPSAALSTADRMRGKDTLSLTRALKSVCFFSYNDDVFLIFILFYL
jgi:hypothetical protein